MDSEKLIRKVSDRFGKEDVLIIKKAFEFAKLAHTGETRLSGDPFIVHPLAVALILADWKLDLASVVAGLVHDTVDLGAARREDIAGEFGEEVAELVDGVTNITHLRLRGSRDEVFIENLRKMLLVVARDLRVVLIKLADRLHNLETLWALPKEKQLANSEETFEIYAPLAERLEMGEVKGQLEDLAFPYLYPREFKELVAESKSFYKDAELRMKTLKRKILLRLTKAGLKATVNARKKHLYSFWKKLKRSEIGGDFEKVYDIVALRILVETVSDCYSALGVVHREFKPVPSIPISDFIAQPKPNGYQSIHTRVFGPKGKIVEVQIRTYKMHDQAEYGVAAHWAYSESKTRGLADEKLEKGVFAPGEKLSWMRQLLGWQKETLDSKEFLSAVKFDAFAQRNYVFSPKGDVFDLPQGATPVDFAYSVHTKLGNQIAGAKVDGRMVPLDHKLKSGQVVEIIKSKYPKGPNKDWLGFVVTTLARRQIMKYLRKTLKAV